MNLNKTSKKLKSITIIEALIENTKSNIEIAETYYGDKELIESWKLKIEDYKLAIQEILELQENSYRGCRYLDKVFDDCCKRIDKQK